MNDKEDIYKLDDEDLDFEKEYKEDPKKKLIRYGIYFLVGFVLFIFLLAFITSCSNKSKKKTSNQELTLIEGEKYSLNYDDYTWTSSNLKIAKVTENDEIEALKKGDAEITITKDNEIIIYKIHIEEEQEEDTEITGVKLTQNTISIEKDEIYELKYNLIPNVNKEVMLLWFSSNEDVAIVEDGMVKGLTPGISMITVKTENGSSDTCLVKVTGEKNNYPVKKITIDSENVTINKGSSYALSYDVNPTDSINLVEWISSDTSIATVENGVIYALSKGNVKITAKANKVEKSIDVAIIDNEENNLKLNQSEISLNQNETYKLILNQDVHVTWSSSNSSVATVSDGVVTAKNKGNAVITATVNDNQKLECNVVVVDSSDDELTISLNFNNVTMNVKESIKLVETVSPKNNVSNVVWSSSDNNVAIVNNGVVSAYNPGTAIITATLPNGNKAECKVVVSQKNVSVLKVTINLERVTINVGGVSQLSTTVLPSNATDKKINWTSSNSNIAKVDSNGKVTGISKGSALIYATSSNGVFDECEVTVN